MSFHNLSLEQLVAIAILSSLILVVLVYTTWAVMKIAPYDYDEATTMVGIFSMQLAFGLIIFLWPFCFNTSTDTTWNTVGGGLCIMIGVCGHLTFTDKQLVRAKRHSQREISANETTQ